MADILETRVLDALRKHGELTSSDLAVKLLSPRGNKTTITRCLQRLTGKGFIEFDIVNGINVYRCTPAAPVTQRQPEAPEEAPEIDYSVRDEAGIAREWRKLAKEEEHHKGVPRSPQEPHPMTEIDSVFGDGSTIAAMGHDGYGMDDIAVNHGVKRTQLATWFAKHRTGIRALMAKFPKQEQAA